MTKPIASVAVLMLLEQGKFQLDDPVSNYLPEFADVRVFTGGTAEAPELREPKRPLTIRHLLDACRWICYRWRTRTKRCAWSIAPSCRVRRTCEISRAG